MDLGLFNKKTEPRGDHGTLIGNWVEERALQQVTGFARYEDLAIEKRALNQTQHRIVSHSAHSSYRDAQSISRSTYINHGTESFQPKIFNQTGSHWHHDEGRVTAVRSRKDMASQLSLGSETTNYSTTQGSSFAASINPAQPLPIPQRTASLGPRPFPENTATGGAGLTKLDRPYSGQTQ